jgi:plasminogen activator
MTHYACLGRPLPRALLVSAAFAVTLPIGGAGAEDGADKLWRAPSAIVTEFSIGAMRGKAQEFVYNPDGSTLSRLDWTFDNVAMFNTATAYQILPWLKLGVKGSMNLSDSSTMDDFDFNLPFCPPPDFNCHSNHPSTKLRQARTFEVYGAADFYRSGGLTFSALAGYKDTFYKWAAIGGTANYGALPPGLGISYEQSWSTPYIGLAFSTTRDAWTLNGRVIGSAWARGDDKDNHHLRSLKFTDKFGSTNMLSADLGIAYRMNRYLSVTADYRFERWGTGKGPTTITDFIGGATVVIPGDAAGANAETHAISVGLKIDLQPADAAPSTKDGYAEPLASWTGWNVGIGGGYDWQRNGWTTTALIGGGTPPLAASVEGDFNDAGSRAGIFLGHSWQRGNWVFGLEGDVGKSNASSTHLGIHGILPPAFQPLLSDATVVGSGYDASLRVRAGTLVTSSLLLYATGGVALQQTNASLSCPDGISAVSWCIGAPKYEEISKWNVGWTAGVGYEMAVAGNWFTRGEYRYTSIGSFDHEFFAATPIDSVSATIDPSGHRLAFSVGYRY